MSDNSRLTSNFNLPSQLTDDVKLNLAQSNSVSKLRGSALIMAVFVMVVISLLGATMMELLSTSSEGVAQEVLGTRALAAANSGMQGQLQKLFPLNGATGTCPATTNYNFSTLQGLYECQADVTCSNYVTGNDGTQYYRLKSTGTCGSGSMVATSDNIVLSSRTVQVEARSL